MFELTQLTYFQILGKPLIMYMGIISFLLLIVTMLIPILNRRKITKIPMKIHFRLAYITLIFVIIHAILGLAPYF